MKVDIGGIIFDNTTPQQLEERLEQSIFVKRGIFIVTPNPEFVVLAHRDDEFREILNRADYSVPDGVGIILASRLLGQNTFGRITGSQVTQILCRIAGRNRLSVFLFGGAAGVAQAAAQKLSEQHPELKIAGTLDGVPVTDISKIDPKIISTLQKAKPDILIVALGQGRQEKFLYYNLKKLPSVACAVGVGGVFDYLAGRVPRAPVWIQALGLEWLFRLAIEPRRWQRIARAVFIFPIIVILHHFAKKS